MLWIHASTAARFEQSVRDIADQLKLAGRKDLQANIYRLLQGWLRNESNGRWLVVLDNADDANFLVVPPATSGKTTEDTQASPYRQSVYECLPVCEHGTILITTRSRTAASKLVDHGDVIDIHPMDNDQAVALLERKLGHQYDRKDNAELVTILESMPLAIAQAAAYIKQRAPRCSVQQYIEKLQIMDKSKTGLLDRDEGDLRRDRESTNSIILTWQISFEYINHVRQSAADLLSLMSFFDRHAIPESLLWNRNEKRQLVGQIRTLTDNARKIVARMTRALSRAENKGKVRVWEADSNQELEDDIKTLQDYSFISITADGAAFEMHRLVQLSAQRWLEARRQLERWRNQFINNLSAAFPISEYQHWAECQQLFPHAKLALNQKPKGRRALLEWTTLLHKASVYAWRQGRWAEAEELEVRVVETMKKVLGKEHPDTLVSIGNLASTYWNQGRWTEAEELEERVMETRKKVLGKEHPDTLVSIGNLASTYRNQGRWAEAEELEERVMETRKKVLGKEHPDTLRSIGNLASTYSIQGRWTEAEELEVRVMETRKKVLGEEHPDTLVSIGNLASTYRNQGRWTEAEEFEVRAVESSKKVLGEEYPDTLKSIGNLASTYQNQGRWAEAEELEERVIETSKKVLGEEHPDTLRSIENLGHPRKC